MRTGQAIVRGDVKGVARETAFVAVSGAKDVASAFRQKATAARQRLMMRH